MENILRGLMQQFLVELCLLLQPEALLNVKELAQEGGKLSSEFFLKMIGFRIRDVNEHFFEGRSDLGARQLRSKNRGQDRTLETCLGTLHYKSDVYRDKDTGEQFAFTREVLELKPYQKMSAEMEQALVDGAADESYQKTA